MLAKQNAKGCSRPYRQPRGISAAAAEPSVEASDTQGAAAPPAPSPVSPPAAGRTEPTDVTGTTAAAQAEDPPSAKRVKFAEDSSAGEEDTASADAHAQIVPAPCDAQEQQLRAPLPDCFAPFLASLDQAEKAAAELLRGERAHWEAQVQALTTAHAEELRRVREEGNASITALSTELVEARHQLAGPRDTVEVEALTAQLAQAHERMKAAEQAVASAMHKATAAATTLSAVRDAAAAALRRLEA